MIDEQAVLKDVDDRAPVQSPEGRQERAGSGPWREPVQVVPEEEEGDRGWAGGEATGMSGSGMPEAASQADDPGTDTDITLPRVKKRINVDRV